MYLPISSFPAVYSISIHNVQLQYFIKPRHKLTTFTSSLSWKNVVENDTLTWIVLEGRLEVCERPLCLSFLVVWGKRDLQRTRSLSVHTTFCLSTNSPLLHIKFLFSVHYFSSPFLWIYPRSDMLVLSISTLLYRNFSLPATSIFRSSSNINTFPIISIYIKIDASCIGFQYQPLF